MAPKRHRASTSSELFDRHRFVDIEASKRYHESVVKRNLIPERGLKPCCSNQREIFLIIRDQGWEDFVKQPEAAVVSLVREFYANMDESSLSVIVRGKLVKFDHSTINRFYKLPNIDNDEYSTYINDELNLEQVLETIGRPGAQWTMRGDDPLSFQTSELNNLNKAWLSFIGAKLKPVTHYSDVNKDRAILLYAIVTGKSIDVGRIIQQSIRHSRRASTTGGLGHPSLITALCREAGVTWQQDEELLHPKSLIHKNFIARLKSWDSPLASNTGASSSRPPCIPKHPSSKSRKSMEEQFDNLQREVENQRQELTQFFSYQVAFNSSLVQLFNQCGFNTGPNAVQFPSAPTFHEHPPPNNDNEEDAS